MSKKTTTIEPSLEKAEQIDPDRLETAATTSEIDDTDTDADTETSPVGDGIEILHW